MSDVAAGQSRRSFLAPFLLFGVTSWFIYHGNYIADESYAYLIVARNLVLHGRQSFSDIFPTNGFQPLWQYLLAGYTWQLAQFKPAWLYEAGYAIPLSAAMLCSEPGISSKSLSGCNSVPFGSFICQRPTC